MFKEIYKKQGEDNTGGLKAIGYYFFMEDVVGSSYPAAPDADTAASLEEYITITGDITFKPGKTMYPMYGTIETGGLDGEGQGERDSQSTKRTLTWQHPGTRKEALGFAKAVLNRDMGFIPIEHNGQKRLLGTPAVPAMCVPKDTTGKASTDFKGVTFEISDFGFGPAPVFEGTIVIDSSLDLGV